MAERAGIQILIVDDEPEIRSLLRDCFAELGYGSTEAGDGEAATDLAAAHDYDLVVTDIRMPRKDGLELTRWLRGECPDLPIIIMSGYADFKTAQEALRLGVFDYLSKPFENLAEVKAAVRRAVETRSRRAEPAALAEEFGRRVDGGDSTRYLKLGTDGEPRIVGGFELLEKIAEGGMGTVYKALQTSMKRVVAVKLISAAAAGGEDQVKRLVLEARAAARLDHPNIVRGIDVGREGDFYYFAMELIDGESLADLIERRGSLPEDEAVGIALQVAEALDHIWKIGLVHRDVKPHNVLLTREGMAKLTDLGLVKPTHPEWTGFTRSGFAVGSPSYIPPEQARGEKDIDIRADIYSLGVTLFEMVTGSPPFVGNTEVETISMHLTEYPPPANTKNAQVSKRTSLVIDKMLQKKPSHRYVDPGRLIVDLRLLLEGREPRYA